MPSGQSKKLKLSLLIVLGIILLFWSETVKASDGEISMSLKIGQKFNIESTEGVQVNEQCEYELTSENMSAPMPEESTDGSLHIILDNATREKDITFTYAESGTYVYYIRQITEEKAGYEYDQEEYTLTVNITGTKETGLIPQVILTKANGEKCSDILFSNIYKNESVESSTEVTTEEITEETKNTVDSSDENLDATEDTSENTERENDQNVRTSQNLRTAQNAKTGDKTPVEALLYIMTGSILVIVLILLRRYRKHNIQ